MDRGADVEIVRCVLAERGNDPALAHRSVAEMSSLQASGALTRLVAAFARPTRIVRGKQVDGGLKVRGVPAQPACKAESSHVASVSMARL